MNKLIAFVLVGGFAVFANATELWWTIGDDAEYGDIGSEGWSQLAVFATTGDKYGYNYGGEQVGDFFYSKDVLENVDYIATNIDGYDPSIYSFYVELLNSDGNGVGASYITMGTEGARAQGATQYSDVKSALYAGGMSTVTPTPYSFNQFTTSQVVPEPTSGLLMLIGLAGLALKRKRA